MALRLSDRFRRSVFGRVALVLVGAQVATALLAVALSGAFAQERSRDLLIGTLQLRLDAVAEEVEERADIGPLGSLDVPDRLRDDLVTRFPDPVHLLDDAGDPLGAEVNVPPDALDALDAGRVRVALDGPSGSWGLAPVLAADGLPAGAVLVQPLTETVREETEATRAQFVRALWVVSLIAAALALALGALLTWWLVRPLLRVTQRVERLGEGDYAGRLPVSSDDELGRLARAINEMAERVDASVGALRDADRLRRELVANVGHDLRTPLAALGGYLEEAERLAQESRTEQAAEALESARRQQGQIADLVADLFELSVLERPTGQVPLRLGPVPLGELVSEAARTHRPAFEAAGIEFVLDIPTGLPVIEADGSRLLRLLGNLLDNARRHTPEGGSVTLRVRVEDESVRVDVDDTGEGIAPDVLPTVFERYYRGDTARTRSERGTGLGLAIARAIAHAHSGTLDAQSGVEGGSQFSLRLPAGDG